MTNLPSITVITPSFNQGHFITETIESVLSQDYPNLEYWVIDGGSTDNTVQILKSYGKRIKWVSEKDKGQTHAINKGMKLAQGDIVSYLNSDDVFKSNILHLVGTSFSQEKCMWITGDYCIINHEGYEIQSFVKEYKTFFRNFNSSTILSILNYINQPSTFWKRSLFSEIGYFDEDLRYCMDYDFWLRLSQKYKPLILSQELSSFRIHAKSKGGSQYLQQFKEENKVIQRYEKNIVLTTLHKLHSAATVQAYKLIK